MAIIYYCIGQFKLVHRGAINKEGRNDRLYPMRFAAFTNDRLLKYTAADARSLFHFSLLKNGTYLGYINFALE